MLAKEEELIKVKAKQVQAEERVKEYESKQQQVGFSGAVGQSHKKMEKVAVCLRLPLVDAAITLILLAEC